MWIATQNGFFSVVAKSSQPDMIKVRARLRSDLEELRDTYFPGAEIYDTPHRDYQCRLFCSREHLAEAMGNIARDLEYTNFKAHVGQKQGYARASLYGKVWSIMHRLIGLGKDNGPPRLRF